MIALACLLLPLHAAPETAIEDRYPLLEHNRVVRAGVVQLDQVGGLDGRGGWEWWRRVDTLRGHVLRDRIVFLDGSVLRDVRGPLLRTWTDHDPERLDAEIRPVHFRRPLTPLRRPEDFSP